MPSYSYLVFVRFMHGEDKSTYLNSVWSSKEKAWKRRDVLLLRDVGTKDQLQVAVVQAPISFYPSHLDGGLSITRIENLPWANLVPPEKG